VILVALLLTSIATSRTEPLVDAFECARCHEVPGHVVPDEKSCTACHRSIRAGTFETDAAHLERWRKDVRHLLDVPSLSALNGRVRRTWVERFLLAPVDVRPGLEETMPRLALSPDDARRIAVALVPDEPDERPLERRGDAARGRVLVDERCAPCHAADPRAPRLSLAAARMTERSLDAWLRDPPSSWAGSSMPRVPLTDDERADVVAFLVVMPHEEPRALPERLPLLDRRVRFDEVDARVFRRSCWHCHSDPDLAGGDGGPGNTGGFGYRGAGLSLASAADVRAGSVGADGVRHSVLVPMTDGPWRGSPRLVAHLLARQAEARAEEGGVPPRPDAPLGMPLGLPPLSPEDLRLVETWIAQGARP
jgi:mono/diheme cytochrome c family protein